MDYNTFINKYRESKKFDEEKTQERLRQINSNETLSETPSSTEPIPEEKKEKGSI